MIESQLERIRTMEQALNEASRAVETAQTALAQYESTLPQLRTLAQYYESPLWLQDYDADAAGALPTTLSRGVLSQDALYDLLCNNDRLTRTLLRLAGTLRGSD